MGLLDYECIFFLMQGMQLSPIIEIDILVLLKKSSLFLCARSAACTLPKKNDKLAILIVSIKNSINIEIIMTLCTQNQKPDEQKSQKF
jgi:hypothetical protein